MNNTNKQKFIDKDNSLLATRGKVDGRSQISVKRVKFVVTKGDFTLGDQHTMQRTFNLKCMFLTWKIFVLICQAAIYNKYKNWRVLSILIWTLFSGTSPNSSCRIQARLVPGPAGPRSCCHPSPSSQLKILPQIQHVTLNAAVCLHLVYVRMTQLAVLCMCAECHYRSLAYISALGSHNKGLAWLAVSLSCQLLMDFFMSHHRNLPFSISLALTPVIESRSRTCNY